MSVDVATLSIGIDSRPVRDLDSALGNAATSGLNLEGVIKKVAAGLASWEIVKQIRDVTTLAARYDTLGVVMQTIGNNAGYTGKEMAGFQASLEKTGISMLAARQALTMMAAAQLDLTKASQLGRVAQDAAVIGNVNSSEAFETLTRSITTGMAIEAHRLGIMVNYQKAEHDLAASIGKTTAELTQHEKEQARLNEVLAQGALRQGAYESAMETAGKQALSMERYVENLKIKLGETFQGAYAVIIQDMTAALKGAAAWVDKNTDKLKDLGGAMTTVVKQGAEFTRLLASIGGGADGASNSVGFLTRLFQGLGFLMAGATDILRAFAGQFVGFIGFLIQKLGAVADVTARLVSLGAWSGKSGISNAGDSVSNWGKNIMAPLESGNSALTSWYDDVFGEKAVSGSTKASEALEQQRIAAGNAARAMAEASSAGQGLYETNRSLYWLESSRGGDGWAAGNAHALGAGRTVAENLLAPGRTNLDTTKIKLLKSYEDVRIADMKLRAEAGDTWAIIGTTVVETSSYAADALTRWSSNVDGLGRSWTTLGNTVRNVIADMLRQMERAIIQQKLMDPLLHWVTNPSTWSWFTGGSGVGYGSSGIGTTGSGGSGIGSGVGKLFNTAGGATSAPIVVHVNVNGPSDITTDSKTAAGVDLAKRIARGEIQTWAMEQTRSGGLFARA